MSLDEELIDGPLTWTPVAIAWSYYEVDQRDQRIVRIGFAMDGGPDRPVSDVIVSETHDSVSIVLRARFLAGADADGVVYGDGAIMERWTPAWLELQLAEPLGHRRVVDGGTGRTPQPFADVELRRREQWEDPRRRRCAHWRP
jgi:hypothetical protein